MVTLDMVAGEERVMRNKIPDDQLLLLIRERAFLDTGLQVILPTLHT